MHRNLMILIGQSFSLKVRNVDGGYDGGEALEITVYDYFTKHRNIERTYSAFMPCLDVGNPKRPNYLLLELRAAIKKSTAIFDKEKAQKRLTKLSGGVAVFKGNIY
ncbi:unnamed protein product [Camellia sinensis]